MGAFSSRQKTINDLPNEILVDGIFTYLSQADRLNQQRTCRRWNQIMPFADECLKVIPLIEEMLSLLHGDREEKTDSKTFPLVMICGGRLSSHNFDHCKTNWSWKGPKIIEKCLKVLLESKKLKSVKHLEIIDKSRIWTISEGCVKVIVSNCIGLESLHISGKRMMPAIASMELFFSLDASNLTKFRLAGVVDEKSMWSETPFRSVSPKSVPNVLIRRFIERSTKLEILSLHFGECFPDICNDVTFKFPASLRELDIGVFARNESVFRLDSLSKCRENLVKLRVKCAAFDQTLMHISEHFTNLTEFVASNTIEWRSTDFTAIDPTAICDSHPNLTSLCFGFRGLPIALCKNYLL